MLLLLVRHAIAEDRVGFARSGQADDLRPLTGEGKKKMRPIAEALHELFPEADLLLTSPLTRARQTAQILGAAAELAPFDCPALKPDADPAAVLKFLQSRRDSHAAIAVGHEPALGQLAGFAVTGRSAPLFVLKKGGACLLEFPSSCRPGAASLIWLLSPGQLRRLAGV